MRWQRHPRGSSRSWLLGFSRPQSRYLSSVNYFRSSETVRVRDGVGQGSPFKILLDDEHVPEAYRRWFDHDGSGLAELNITYWSQFEETIVPLELSTTDNTTFHRTEAPLGNLLRYLELSKAAKGARRTQSIYLAQCSISSLPPTLQENLPVPAITSSIGRGDIYESSLWLGRPPTYTPLHKDPNPNILMQLAGRKVVRLLSPEAGNMLFDHVQLQLHRQGVAAPGSASLRGEEMMSGPEADELHCAVWEEDRLSPIVQSYGFEVWLDACQALFVPKGWWHSVKGVGEGVTASANWWFR